MFDILVVVGGVILYKMYNFKLYPNSEQRTLIYKTFGCTMIDIIVFR